MKSIITGERAQVRSEHGGKADGGRRGKEKEGRKERRRPIAFPGRGKKRGNGILREKNRSEKEDGEKIERNEIKYRMV